MNVVVVIMNCHWFNFCLKLIFHKVKQKSISDRETEGTYIFSVFFFLFLTWTQPSFSFHYTGFTLSSVMVSHYTGVVFLFSVLELLSGLASLSSVPIPLSLSTVEDENGGGCDEGAEFPLDEFCTPAGLWDLRDGSVPLIIMVAPPPPLSLGKQLCNW